MVATHLMMRQLPSGMGLELMDERAAQEMIVAVLASDDAFADLMVQPTAEQLEALEVLDGCTDAAEEDVQTLVWEAVGDWPNEGRWDEIAGLLVASIGGTRAQIEQGAAALAALRQSREGGSDEGREGHDGQCFSRTEAFAIAREFMFGAGVSGAKADRLAQRAVRMWERGRKSEFPSFSARNHALVVEATYAIEDIERRRNQ